MKTFVLVLDGMADEPVEQLEEIRSHCPVCHFIGMRRPPVVALVHCNDSEFLAECRAQCMPVVERTQKPVEDNEGMTGSVFLEEEGHREGLAEV